MHSNDDAGASAGPGTKAHRSGADLQAGPRTPARVSGDGDRPGTARGTARDTGRPASGAARPDAPSPAGAPRRRLDPFAVWAVAMPLALLLLAACAAFTTGMATAPDTAGVDTAAIVSAPIDPARYATADAHVRALAALPVASLYAGHLDGAPADYGRLDERQRAAVVAAWQAWLRDPAAFDGLDSRDYYLHAFDSYLLHLGHATGDREPLIDRGRLQLGNHESLARQRWSDASLMFPDDPLLEALATEHSLTARVWHWTGRGVFHWVERLTGRSMVDRVLAR